MNDYSPSLDPCRVCGNDSLHVWEPSRDGSRLLVLCAKCRTILESYPPGEVTATLEERAFEWKN